MACYFGRDTPRGRHLWKLYFIFLAPCIFFWILRIILTVVCINKLNDQGCRQNSAGEIQWGSDECQAGVCTGVAIAELLAIIFSIASLVPCCMCCCCNDPPAPQVPVAQVAMGNYGNEAAYYGQPQPQQYGQPMPPKY